MRRMSTLAGTAALATLATVAFSPSAQAATSGTCRLVVPAQVRIVGPYQAVKTTLSGTCTSYASSVFATWTGYTSQGAEDGVLFDSVTSDYWDIYDWHTLGVVSWREAWATEQNNWNEFTPQHADDHRALGFVDVAQGGAQRLPRDAHVDRHAVRDDRSEAHSVADHRDLAVPPGGHDDVEDAQEGDRDEGGPDVLLHLEGSARLPRELRGWNDDLELDEQHRTQVMAALV